MNFKCQKSGCGGNHHTLMHCYTTATGGEPKTGTGLREKRLIQTMVMLNNSHKQDKEMLCLVMLLGPATIEKPLWQQLGPEKTKCVLGLCQSKFKEKAVTAWLKHMPCLTMVQR